MKRIINSLMVVVATVVLGLSVVDQAQAKKGFSGGGSFGSKFSHSKPVKRDSASPSRQAAATPAQQKNLDRKQALAQKGGLAGMLGALAIGGLLGALFFGGAFENINFFDILIFGLIAFILFKMLGARARQQNRPAAAGGYGDIDMENDSVQQRESASDLFGGSAASSDGLDALRTGIVKGFEEDAFLEGAKSCFRRLQRAWDEGDLADIRQFTTDHVFAEIQDRLQQRTGQSSTEVKELRAELLSADDLGSKQEASVLFEGVLIEDGEPTQIQEVWHFTRPANSTQPTWFLDGIQQVEE